MPTANEAAIHAENEALRQEVVVRKISGGTQSAEGSKRMRQDSVQKSPR